MIYFYPKQYYDPSKAFSDGQQTPVEIDLFCKGQRQEFSGGRGVDDLFWPMHLNFKFFGMTPMETSACDDVMKNPDVENDFSRFDVHLNHLFFDVQWRRVKPLAT